MMVLNILFLPMVFFIGVITSYEDFKYGLIRNKWIKLGICWGLFILSALFIWNFVALSVTNFYYFKVLDLPVDSPAPVFTVHLSFFWGTIINVSLATLVSFAMWRFGVWAAGDAKLFIVYSLLIPISNYWKSFLPLFPSLALLINIFIIILFYVLLRSCYLCLFSMYYSLITKTRSVNTEKRIHIQLKNFIFSKVKSLKGMGAMFLVVFLIILFFAVFQPLIQRYIEFDIFYLQIIIFALIIIFSDLFSKVLKNKIFIKIITILLVLIGGYSLVINFSYTLFAIINSFVAMVVFMFIFSFFQGIMNFYIDKTAIRSVNVNNLTQNIVLTKEQLNSLKNVNLGEISPRGLNKEQLGKIKETMLRNNIKEVKAYKFMPFAIWMFVGVVLTLLLNGSSLNFIKNFVKSMIASS